MRSLNSITIAILLMAQLKLVAQSGSSNYESTVRGNSFQSSSRLIIDEKTIQESKSPNITTLLATQANISVASTSTQPSGLFLRGGDSSHILILVDGLPFFDPSTAQKTANLNNIDIKTIRRIEILKGPQSVLYGGQALTGVIKIETFPLELQDKTYAGLEIGNSNYSKLSAAQMLSNPNQDQAVIVKGNAAKKSQSSPVKNSSRVYPQNISSYEVAAISRKELSSFVKFSGLQEQNELQNSNNLTFAPIDTNGFDYKNRSKSVSAGLSLPNYRIRPRLILGHQDSVRNYDFAPSTADHYGSALTNVRFESDLISNDSMDLLVGLSYQQEKYVYRGSGVETSNYSNEHRGVFGKLTYTLSDLMDFEFGLRSDHISKQDRADSFQLGLTFLDWIKLEYATGFKTASLFQLYGMFGNSELAPEKSRTYSLSADENLGVIAYSFTLFETHFDNLISTSGSFPSLRYNNISRAITRGFELGLSTEVAHQLKLQYQFGYQEPRDITNAKWLARRPLVTSSLGLNQSWVDRSAGLEVSYTGPRQDRASSTTEKQLGSRTILNFNFTQDFNEQFSTYLRVNNLTDQKYEQTSGYYDEGIFGLVGLELSH